ncbi:hypothetical protein Acr_24g0006130 [Actinidia rufa]|uniref:Uncharacterized protein n=1 Tax=Actinidia rufa TaxID=165716 RepID=A0A7J0GUG1_9ERIC|nr:hypothetical protein Acr_24g0006130 [Actinidia rufa]
MKGERGRPGLVNGVRLMVVAHGSFGNEHVSFGGERCAPWVVDEWRTADDDLRPWVLDNERRTAGTMGR